MLCPQRLMYSIRLSMSLRLQYGDGSFEQRLCRKTNFLQVYESKYNTYLHTYSRTLISNSH